MPAITVFSKALKYLGDKITKFIKDAKVVEHPKEITWVITVPAIWQPGARHFMRKAAYAVSFFFIMQQILLQLNITRMGRRFWMLPYISKFYVYASMYAQACEAIFVYIVSQVT